MTTRARPRQRLRSPSPSWARLRSLEPRAPRPDRLLAIRRQACLRQAKTPAVPGPSTAWRCESGLRREVAADVPMRALVWRWSRRNPLLAVDPARLGLSGRMEVPVAAPRCSIELSARSTRHARILDARLLHTVLGPLAGKAIRQSCERTSQSSG